MNTIYIVDLEYIESRYTAQWKEHVPNLIRASVDCDTFDVEVIEGVEDIPQMTTPGAFLNFGGTTVYKARQIEKIARKFCANEIKSGDRFLFTDFWHPGVIFLRYMADLLKIDVEVHGMIHAGAYDPQDFLGRAYASGKSNWMASTEKAMFDAFDTIWFATEFHVNMFKSRYEVDEEKISLTGWPFEFMNDQILNDIKGIQKEKIVVFPHRIAPEKQLWTFKLLEKHYPEWKFVVAQELNLSKREYHELLGRSMFVWSAALQETLGISTCIEGPIAGCIPIAPNHLSYSEIFAGKETFLYPAEYIKNSHEFFEQNINLIIDRRFDRYEELSAANDRYVKHQMPLFAKAYELVYEITRPVLTLN